MGLTSEPGEPAGLDMIARLPKGKKAAAVLHPGKGGPAEGSLVVSTSTLSYPFSPLM